MQITPNFTSQTTTFKGTLSKQAIEKVKSLEKSAILKEIERANYKGEAVKPEVIEKIRKISNNIIKSLQEKAESLFKDSAIIVRKDTKQFFVKNEKLAIISP